MIFDPFNDFASEGYLRNQFKLKDASEIKRLEHLSFETSLEEALGLLERSERLTYQTYLRPCVVEASNRDRWPALISGIKGLDGLDKDGISYASLDDPEVVSRYKGYRCERT